MIEDPPLRILRIRLTYLLIIILVVLFQTLPIPTSPYQFAVPDFPLVITVAWIMRRPDVMSPILIAIAFLFADMMLQRPPGLWTLIVLLTSIFLRMRARGFQEVIFLYEWLMVAVVISIAFIVYNFALLLTFLPPQNIKLSAMQTLLTILVYPIFTWIFRSVLRYSLYINMKNKFRKPRYER